MKRISGKVVIVTGASAGIGAAMVRALAAAGANVVLVARSVDKLETLVEELAKHDGKRKAISGDLQSEAFCRKVIDETVQAFGRIDVLINNAGLGHRNLLSTMPRAHMNTIVDTNLLAPLHLSQAAIPYMRAQRSGQIINVSSIVGQRPLPRSGFYCASKTALNFVSRSMRMELRKDNITVTLLYPGLTATNFHEAILGEGRNQRRWAGVSAEKVAAVTLKAIQKRRLEVYVTPIDWAFTHLNRLFPRLTDRLISILWRG